MRNRDPRFFLFLAAFWFAFAIYTSGAFAQNPHWTAPRVVGMCAALIASAIAVYRYTRARRPDVSKKEPS
ncbi:MAG: hypothetical protein H7X80_00150 [bacterium]|nr:hypothetical protein [Candidatus Kapabacteria bacterium]